MEENWEGVQIKELPLEKYPKGPKSGPSLCCFGPIIL